MLQMLLHYIIEMMINISNNRELQGLSYTTENTCVNNNLLTLNPYNSFKIEYLQKSVYFLFNSKVCYKSCYKNTCSPYITFPENVTMLQNMLQCYKNTIQNQEK